MQQDLFLQQQKPMPENERDIAPDLNVGKIQLSRDAVLYKGALIPIAETLLQEIAAIARHTPFRHRFTPGGKTMSVAMTNCGEWGWVTDSYGYRYARQEPETGNPWLSMPEPWSHWANQFAEHAGFDRLNPDACLINRYAPGAAMGLHQDRDEADLRAAIVSFSLGVPASFIWGGFERQHNTKSWLLEHGDVLVWGAGDRMRFHGVKKLHHLNHPLTGVYRYNLTFRRSQYPID